jgi:DNA-binding LytR/AlgR family response regulator
MKKPIKIFIVEDEMIIAANISLQLSKLGYEISGIVSRGEDAILHIKENKPDIILLDIQLKGKLDGIETAKLILKEQVIPIIYLTANVDDAHFKRAKETKPHAFISKPFKKLDLQHAIELTINRINTEEVSNEMIDEKNTSQLVLNDCIFVRDHEKMVKVYIKDIYYIQADRNYSRIHAKNGESLLVMTLKEIDEKLPNEHFLRIHRSYIVNLAHVDEVANSHVVVMRKAIPITKSLRAGLLNRIQTI